MAATCSVVGSIIMGGGLMIHAEYKLQVNKDDESWCVYRRYSDFASFHKVLFDTFGEERLVQDSVALPDKQIGGSQISTLKSVVEEREKLLQRYMDGIQQFEDYSNHAVYGMFLDYKYKGLSGIQREMGKNKVLKETFTHCKHVKHVNAFWKMRFVAILKSGTVVVMRSMYDDSTKAVVTLSLTSGTVQVVPKASDNVILFLMKSVNQSLSVSFSTPGEAAFWIRTVSDFALTTNTDGMKARSASVDAASTPSKAASTPPRQQQQTTQAVEEIRAAGTGNTKDELSEMLGI